MSSEERKLYITKFWVRFIFFYYSVLFFLGLYITIETLLNIYNVQDIFKAALVGSMAISVSGSSVAYIRKLYKLCFRYSSDQEEEDQIHLKRLGTVFYFITRPIFSLLFSVLIVIGLSSGVFASSDKISLNQGFIFVSMFLSFYAGFLSGDLIKKLEKNGNDSLDKFVS